MSLFTCEGIEENLSGGYACIRFTIETIEEKGSKYIASGEISIVDFYRHKVRSIDSWTAERFTPRKWVIYRPSAKNSPNQRNQMFGLDGEVNGAIKALIEKMLKRFLAKREKIEIHPSDEFTMKMVEIRAKLQKPEENFIPHILRVP